MEELYEQYLQYVDDEFAMGAFEELYEDGFTELVYKTKEETKYRVLTMEEYVGRKIYEKNNQFNG